MSDGTLDSPFGLYQSTNVRSALFVSLLSAEGAHMQGS